MKKYTCIALVLFFVSIVAGAHTVHLKDGKTLDCKKCWKEGGTLKMKTSSGVSSIPYSKVDYIEYAYDGSTKTTGSPAKGKKENKEEISSGKESSKSPAPSRKDIEMGDIYELKSKLDESENKTRLKKKLASMYNRLGLKKMNSGKFSRAESHFRSALLYAGDKPEIKINLASSLLRQEKQYEAKDFLMRAVLNHPKNAVLHYLLGKSYYHFNDLEQALEEFQKSYKLNPRASTKKSIRRIKKEIKMTGDNVGTESSHFVVSHKYGKDPEIIDKILDSLEDGYSRVTSELNFYPDSKITVVVMPSKEFHKFTGKPGWVGGVFDGKIRIPTKGLSSVNRQVQRILTHELTHALIYSKTGGSTPRWLHEGLAQFMEDRNSEINNQRILQNSGYGIPFRWNGPQSYKSSLSFITFLVKEYGFYRINNLLDSLVESESIEKALKDVFHNGREDLRDKWLKTLEEK